MNKKRRRTRRDENGHRRRKRRPEKNDDGDIFESLHLETDTGVAFDERSNLITDVPVRFSDSYTRKATVDAPSIWLEALRLQAVRRLSDAFRDNCGPLGSRKKHYAHFEAWLWTARAESTIGEYAAPVMPAIPQCTGAARDELSRKLVRGGLSEKAAHSACDVLNSCASKLIEELATAAHGNGSTTQTKIRVSRLKTAASKEETSGDMSAGVMLQLSCGAIAVTLSENHLRKLWALFKAAAERKRNRKRKRCSSSCNELMQNVLEPCKFAFGEAAFSMLARLLTLQGGHEKAGGMQAACPASVFDVLRADFGVTMELFASPINTRFPCFCSAAPDVDGAFGSLGSFFTFKPLSGAFVANPPFEPTMVSAMACHMERLLEAALEAQRILTFVVVLPHWPEQLCWQLLRDSPHASFVLNLPRSKHAYIDGGQHYRRRKVALRLSNHDSTIFFLQSQRAAMLAPVTLAKQRRLLEAFRAGW